MREKIQRISTDFFEKLGANYSKLYVKQELENIYTISLQSEDSHLLIGPHGKNLETLTHILKLLISKKTETRITLRLEINDYLKQKEEKLLQFIQKKIQFVEDSGKEIILPFFTAYERKKVHSYVGQSGAGVYTESHGEGAERRMHICKKDEAISIDLDGDDI